jgi:hypothetical protein
MVPEALFTQKVTKRCSRLGMAQPLLNVTDRGPKSVAERGKGVSELVRGNSFYPGLTAGPGHGLFNVVSRHLDPAPSMADKKVVMAGIVRAEGDKQAPFKIQFEVGPGGSTQGNLSLFRALTLTYKYQPILQINILKANINGLRYPQAGIEHQRVQRQVTHLSPAPIFIGSWVGTENVFNPPFEVIKEGLKLFAKGCPGQAARPARFAEAIEGIIKDKPAPDTEPDKVPDNGVVGIGRTLFVILKMFKKSDYSFWGWRPARAKGPVNIQDSAVLSQGVGLDSSTGEQEKGNCFIQS